MPRPLNNSEGSPELVQAQVMRILKYTQEIEKVIAALLAMRAGLAGRLPKRHAKPRVEVAPQFRTAR